MEYTAYSRKAQYYETDQMGIIHHANYIHWMEEARVHFMEQMGFGYDRSVEAGIDFALLDLSCQYRSMVRFGDTVLISVTVTKLTPSRMTVSYRMTDASTGALRATAESSHCYFDQKKQRPVSLKRAIPELYDLFSALCKGEGE